MIEDRFREYLNRKEYNIPLQQLFCTNCKIKHGSADRIYPFSNENIGEFLEGFDLEGKSVITVGSSGDQVLNAVYRGATDVTLFDANIFARYYVELKIAAIKNLSLEEFLKYFTSDNILDWKYYSKVSHDLSDEAKLFWDTLMLELDEENKEIYEKKLFPIECVYKGDISHFTVGQMSNIFCRNVENYTKLQERLKNVTIHYVNDTLKFISNTTGMKKYDLIMLSNVFDYVKHKEFIKVIEYLYANNLNNGSLMQIDYLFYGDTLKEVIESVIPKHLKGRLKCVKVENALTYAQNQNKKASITSDGNVYLEKRMDIVEGNPYQTSIMLEK